MNLYSNYWLKQCNYGGKFTDSKYHWDESLMLAIIIYVLFYVINQ